MGSLEELQEDLQPERAAELLHDGGAIPVDVREPYEHEAGRISGSRHIELDRLGAEAGSLERERPLVLYCRTGGRSAVACQALRASGYDAYNLAGGLAAWVASGLPIEPEGGRVADH